MPIILKCRDVSGSVAFSATRINGLPVPERRYEIRDHTVMLDGYDDALLRHDMSILLLMPDGLYRMLTPQEQDALVAQTQASISIVESAPPAKGKKSDSNGG